MIRRTLKVPGAAPGSRPYLVVVNGLQLDKVPLHASPGSSLSSEAMRSGVDPFAPKGDGYRTNALTSRMGVLLARGLAPAEATQICLALSRTDTPPLDEAKVIRTCESIASRDARHHPERADSLRFAHQPLSPLTPLFDIADAKVDTFLVTQPEPHRWVLQDCLPLGITATIVSPGGVGKSQYLMQLCYSVATGYPVCGHWQVGEEGSVLMLCAEDSAAEIHRRVYRIHTQLGSNQKAGHTAKLISRLFVRSVTGEDMLMTKLAGTGRELLRTSIASRLALTAKQLQDIKLIVLDPASRFRGGDENSNDHGTRFVEALELLGKLTGATVLVAHHASKGASKDGPSQNDSRGASSLTDGVRWQMVLTTVHSKHPSYKALQSISPGHFVEAALVKTNYTAPQAGVYLRREVDGYLQVVKQPPAGSTSDPAMAQLLQVISTSTQPLTSKDIETRFCGRGRQIAVGQRASRGLMKQARDAGLTQGYGLQPLALTKEGHMFLNSAARSGVMPVTPSAGGGKWQGGKRSQ